ncbi:MAG: hypothetical protein DCF13_00935 [Flavobacteriaceae bacterium]|nr:MAG: hypothetical protein DCF13_00935 [Flavobacteriaceae bacterium]
MDVLKEIESQINFIKKEDESNYLDSVFTHIERAEYYYFQGKKDTNYFNDVIYRSNQAYEGALKESYKVLAEKTINEVENKTPNQIEKYFESNNIFRDRVLQLFTNYRQEWRNKSTHDYKLFFDESEAFIALSTVNSFVHLLLKQIQEKLAYLKEQKLLSEEKEIVSEIIESVNKKESLSEMLISLLVLFSRNNGKKFIDSPKEYRELELLGLINAYLDSIGIFTSVQREPKVSIGTKIYRPDFIIKKENEVLLLEILKIRAWGSVVRNAENQILLYMQSMNIRNGILFIAMFNDTSEEIHSRTEEYFFNDIKYTLTVLTAK